MLSVRCLSVCLCLSIMLVYCGQTVGRIKMKLGMQVGLGPGHIVLGGDPAPPRLKGHSPPIFGLYMLRPNGCMDQDVTWYGGRPQPRRLCVRWGPRSPSPKGGGSPNFRPMLRPNGWMDEGGTWHGGRPQPRRLCVRWGLCLAVSVEHRLVTDRQKQDDGIYRASMASRGKNHITQKAEC